MSEFLVCLDVKVGENNLGLFGSIVARVADRKPKTGKVYFRPENRQSYLRGQEVTALKKIASNRIGPEAELISIDGLFANGINVALKASQKKLNELEERDGFAIMELFRLKN
jgi:hypothetical protein